MALDEFRIPWGPMDFSGIADAIQHGRANTRANSYLDLQRQALENSEQRHSAEAERQRQQDQYKRDVDAWTAMPMLQRAAMRSVGMANTNPYGVHFNESRDPVPSPAAPPLAPKAGMPQPVQAAPQPALPPFQLQPDEEGPEQDPGNEYERFANARQPQMQPTGYVPGSGMDGFGDAERQRAADNLNLVGQGLQGEPRNVVKIDEPFVIDAKPEPGDGLMAETPEPPPSALAASQILGMNEPAAEQGKRRLFATYHGQQFELPEQRETTGLGQKYDMLYQRLLEEPGITPKDAFKVVMTDYEKDQAETGRNTRLTRAITGRSDAREDTQTFQQGENEKYKNTFDQKGQLIDRAGAWRVKAARSSQMNPLKIDTANRQDMGSLRQGFAEWKRTVNLSVDSKMHKRLATAMQNLESGNAMQQREAAESLVSIFKGGGQVTKASQELLLNHLAGIVGDAQTWIQHKLSGHYGSAELNVLQEATKNALREEQEKLHMYHESAKDTFGPGSGWEQLGANVNAMTKGAFRQFGYDAEDIYPSATEPVVLGSGKRPATPTATAKPKIPAGAVKGTMNGKRGYVLNGKFTAIE